jgi:hypothetical protein
MDGFFHSVADVHAEVSEVGLLLDCLLAIEGPAWMSHDFDASWEDPFKRVSMLRVAREAKGVNQCRSRWNSPCSLGTTSRRATEAGQAQPVSSKSSIPLAANRSVR